jgi:hypothetical protein
VKLRLWCGIAGIVVVFSGGTMRAQPPQRDRSVQVGVPQGSAQDQAAGAARQQQQQQERARLASEPPPRRADGRILIGSTPTLPGVWVGGNLGFCNSNTVTPPPSLNPGIGRGGGAAPAGATGAAGRDWRHRRWFMHADPVHAVDARRLGRSPAERARAPHALQAVGRAAPVADAVRRRVPRAARAAGGLHLRHRRAAHLPHDLHGRPQHPPNPDAELLRAFDRLVGGRHAGRRDGRLQRGLLDGSRPAPPHRAAPAAREVHAHVGRRRCGTS